MTEGSSDGEKLGVSVGGKLLEGSVLATTEGWTEGSPLGLEDGAVLGLEDGDVLGLVLGSAEGASLFKVGDGSASPIEPGGRFVVGLEEGALVLMTGRGFTAKAEVPQFSLREVHLPSPITLPLGRFSQQPTHVQALSPITTFASALVHDSELRQLPLPISARE